MAPPLLPKLFELAADQDGLFTAEQASDVGVSKLALNRLVKRAAVTRLGRGVYRLAQFPASTREQYREALLWPSVKRREIVPVVLSHATALLLHGVSDANPPKIHVTLPPAVRLRKQVPRSVVVHHALFSMNEVTYVDGLPVTTITRTIEDCHEAHLGSQIVGDAIRDSVDKKLLTVDQARELAKRLETAL